MHAPGVEVRPLRQMTGEAEFNEVYLTEVRVPDADRIGDVGEGWRVAMTTLSNERTTIGGGTGPPVRGSGSIAEAVRIWQSDGSHRNPVARDRLMRLWIEAEVLRLTNLRASQNRRAGNPGPEGSIAKLMFAEVNKRVYELCIDLLGADGHGRLRLHHAPGRGARPGRTGRARPARCSSGRGPTRSRAAPPRSSATSWASGSSGCPVTSGSTRRCRGRRSRGTDVPGPAPSATASARRHGERSG